MKKIGPDELAKLSINEKLDIILEMLGCVDKSIFADGCIYTDKLSANGSRHDKVSLGITTTESNNVRQ
jgi:hypothetical protein